MSGIVEMITRRKEYPSLNLWVTTVSKDMGWRDSVLCRWSNCFYIHFNKADFPNFNYPENNDYYASSFANIDFHGGITFYEETIVSGQTFVKIGCDYQHLFDNETYGREDSGLLILKYDAEKAVRSFIDIYKKLTLEQQNA